MSEQITPLIAGNWKMNGTSASLAEIRHLAELIARGEPPRCTIVVCPPTTLLAQLTAEGASSGIVSGAQDCHPGVFGPHTGDVSAGMLADVGAQYVIVGHSERRAEHGESDELVRLKALAVIGSGLIPIVCVGETREEREAGRAMEVVAGQLAGSLPGDWGSRGIVVAYEPVWAIGTGLTPTSAEIGEMHDGIRALLVDRYDRGAATRILYGGSVKPGNAREILRIENVNGALVGGASLLANDFHAIISAV